MKKIILIFTALLLAGCSTPFTFTGENIGKGYVVLSIGVSESCQSKLNPSIAYLKGVNVDDGRPLNLRNPFISADFEDGFDSVLYSFPLKAGVYEISRLTGGDEFIETYYEAGKQVTKKRKARLKPSRYIIEQGKINYLGNLIVSEVNKGCKEADYKIIKNDKKARDMAIVKKAQPQLFK